TEDDGAAACGRAEPVVLERDIADRRSRERLHLDIRGRAVVEGVTRDQDVLAAGVLHAVDVEARVRRALASKARTGVDVVNARVEQLVVARCRRHTGSGPETDRILRARGRAGAEAAEFGVVDRDAAVPQERGAAPEAVDVHVRERCRAYREANREIAA